MEFHPEAAGFTTIVNPPPPVGFRSKGSSNMAQMTKPEAAGAPPAKNSRKRRRVNGDGLKSFSKLFLPLLAGGGIETLEASRPDWYAKIDPKYLAVGFAFLSYFAKKKGMVEASAVAAFLAGKYVVQAGLAYMIEQDPSKRADYPGLWIRPSAAAAPKPAGVRGLANAVGGFPALDAEMSAAYGRAAVAAQQAQLPAPAQSPVAGFPAAGGGDALTRRLMANAG